MNLILRFYSFYAWGEKKRIVMSKTIFRFGIVGLHSGERAGKIVCVSDRF
jgi:hypothetical protein